MSVIRNRLHAVRCIVIVFVVQMQTSMSKESILLFKVCHCVDVSVYPSQNCVLYGFQNRQWLFVGTALSDWFL